MASRKRTKPREAALLRIIEHFGNAAALARALGVSDAAVGLWYRVPQEHVFTLEKLTGLTRYQMRPDIHGSAPPNLKPQRSQHGKA